MNKPRGFGWLTTRLAALDRAHVRACVHKDGQLKHRIEVEKDRVRRARRRLLLKEIVSS